MSTNPSPEAVKLLAVEQVDRDAAADLIEAYWSGADASMMKLAASYRAGRSQGVWVRAFATHRLASSEKLAEVEAELADVKASMTYRHSLIGRTEARVAAEAQRDALQRQLDLYKEVLSFDCTAFPEMEDRAVKWANKISGPLGQPYFHPDPVMVLEMCEDIAKGALDDIARTTKGQPESAGIGEEG